MARYRLSAEPIGDSYISLLRLLGPHAALFTLVVRPDIALSRHAEDILSLLEEWRVESRRSTAWPGTVLLDGDALVHRFLVTSGSLLALSNAVDSLFAWQQPSAPEDLALTSAAGAPLLTTISHERDAVIELDDPLLQELGRCREWSLLVNSLGIVQAVDAEDS